MEWAIGLVLALGGEAATRVDCKHVPAAATDHRADGGVASTMASEVGSTCIRRLGGMILLWRRSASATVRSQVL
jgi:hypothetical protein